MGRGDLVRTGQQIVEGAQTAVELAATREALSQTEASRQLLEESLADVTLALEDSGWDRMIGAGNTQFTMAGLKRAATLCRVMCVANPLMRRGMNLRTAYVWGQGISVAARATGEGDSGSGQDVNAAVQAFWDDPSNRASLTGPTAQQENERALCTDGNIMAALFTAPVTGRVQARMIPFSEVEQVICNPDDRAEVWFYRRSWIGDVVEAVGLGDTITRQVAQTVYYPALGFQPKLRPKTINGNPVRWDAPMAHLKVNSLSGWDFGVGDAFTAIAWARAYKDFLEDWAKLVKSLSRFAFRASAKTRAGAAAMRDKLNAAPTVNPVTGRSEQAGQTATMTEGQNLEAIPKTGATIDAESGKPLAAMIAAGFDMPVTMLLGDPGITGARATAETLDGPTQLAMQSRRLEWSDFYRRIFDYVIDSHVKAPQGLLTGVVKVDAYTGRQAVTLTGDTDRTVDIVFPDLEETAVNLLVAAIAAADATGKMPPLQTMRLLLEAFNVDDVDELLEEFTDADGQFISPAANAGTAAVSAFRDGADPAALFGGTPVTKPAVKPAASDEPATRDQT